MTLEDRFWSKVHKTDGCWLWTAYKNRDGYGQFGLNRRMRLSHRVSWFLRFGAIADGMSVLHRCDVPACVNPDHLFLGTALDNLKDCKEKGRNQHGSHHWNAKIDIEQVALIKTSVFGGTSQRKVAQAFNLGEAQVSRIVHGKRWAHVA